MRHNKETIEIMTSGWMVQFSYVHLCRFICPLSRCIYAAFMLTIQFPPTSWQNTRTYWYILVYSTAIGVQKKSVSQIFFS